MKIIFLSIHLIFLFSLTLRGQSNLNTHRVYRGVIHRSDKIEIPFTVLATNQKGELKWVIKNAAEKIPLKDIRKMGDSLFTEFPVFESQLHLSMLSNGEYRGYWFKGSAGGYNTQLLSVYPNQHFRFKPGFSKPSHNISGRWAVSFMNTNNKARPAIAEFSQEGGGLTGTFITPSGDYRYLEGIVSGDTLQLSTFDGSHAFYFRAFIENDEKISGGLYCSGTAHKESWSAIKNKDAKLKANIEEEPHALEQAPLKFAFPDLDGKVISVGDKRFRDKVVVIQLMGSWCSNCMDETAFLSDFYQKNKNRGVEILGLAYEYSTDTSRSRKSLQKFQRRFQIQYPVLITGVTASDSLRTQKTLPQLQKMENFPTTLFLDKSGRVRVIDSGFNGPATGEHYAEQTRKFNAIVDELLSE